MDFPKKLKIGELSYDVEYELIFGRTSSIRLKKDKVIVRLSKLASSAEKGRMIEKFLKWAVKRLSKVKAIDFVNPVYENGSTLCTHNKIYEIYVSEEDRKTAGGKLVDGYLIEIKLPSAWSRAVKMKNIKNIAEKVVIKDQTLYLLEVVDELNKLHFRQNFRSCRFKRTSHRFGSLSLRGNINISYRLLFAPKEVFRYVCVHELAHLQQFNHSRRFWEVVANAMPEYKEHERWLKNNGLLLG